MTVTVSPIRAPQQISEPGPFSRYPGRFIGPTAPAQVATLALTEPGEPFDPDGLVVVYEGQIDNEGNTGVFARIISSSGALFPEINVASFFGAKNASVASLQAEPFEDQVENFRQRFVVVHREGPFGDGQEKIYADIYSNHGRRLDGVLIAESKEGKLPVRQQLAPSIAIKDPPMTTVHWITVGSRWFGAAGSRGVWAGDH
jgi:hypothetical protein